MLQDFSEDINMGCFRLPENVKHFPNLTYQITKHNRVKGFITAYQFSFFFTHTFCSQLPKSNCLTYIRNLYAKNVKYELQLTVINVSQHSTNIRKLPTYKTIKIDLNRNNMFITSDIQSYFFVNEKATNVFVCNKLCSFLFYFLKEFYKNCTNSSLKL